MVSNSSHKLDNIHITFNLTSPKEVELEQSIHSKASEAATQIMESTQEVLQAKIRTIYETK